MKLDVVGLLFLHRAQQIAAKLFARGAAHSLATPKSRRRSEKPASRRLMIAMRRLGEFRVVVAHCGLDVVHFVRRESLVEVGFEF